MGGESENEIYTLYHTYRDAYGRYMTPIQLDEINQLIDKHGMEPALLTYGIEKAAKSGYPFTYAAGIFTNWLDKGITTKEQALAEEQEFQRRRGHGHRHRDPQKPLYSSQELGW